MKLNLEENKKGYSLPEVLVVIAIMIVLGTVGGAVFFGAIIESKDVTRTEGLRSIAKVIDNHVFVHRAFPFVDNGAGSGGTPGDRAINGDELGPRVCHKIRDIWPYIEETENISMPQDPNYPDQEYYYAYYKNQYVLISKLEDSGNAHLDTDYDGEDPAVGSPIGIDTTKPGFEKDTNSTAIGDQPGDCNCINGTKVNGEYPNTKYCIIGSL